MLKGIDVSTAQGNINWKLVAGSGINFAMIKATQGRGEGALTKHLKQFKDARFEKNITGAAEAGITLGVYHYFTARNVSDADREAEYFLKTIEPYRDNIDLWAAVDVESKYILDLGKSTLAHLVGRFLNRVEEAEYKSMLYTNPDFLRYRIDRTALGDTDIWLAHWGVSKPATITNTIIWQYGSVGTQADVKAGVATMSSGRIPGINAACDVNHGYFVLPQNFRIGGTYTIRKGDKYTNGLPVPDRLIGKTYNISDVKEGRILLKEIASWVRI